MALGTRLRRCILITSRNNCFPGQHCSSYIDFCKSTPCQHGGTCQTHLNSYRCLCKDGYTGDHCQSKVNECDSQPCHNGGQCVDEDKAYRCKCRTGFTGVNCETPFDQCLSRPCLNNATCTTIGNTFKCNCVAGFAGYNCSVNVDDCLLANCQNNASCMDGIDEYKCVCGPGFYGSLCQYDVNECLSLPCLNNGNCANRNGSYICECPLGFPGKNCEKNVDDCANVTCFNDGKCKDSTCDCHPGFRGEFCKENIDECQPQPCRNGGSCVDGIAGYTCLCTEKWSGEDCTIPNDSCKMHFCENGATCVNNGSSYYCKCASGFTGKYCQMEINECSSSPCHNGDCGDSVNDYHCTCQAGWTGKNCDVDIDYCKDKYCYNNGTCIDHKLEATCKCPIGFYGTFCEYLDDLCKSNPCQNGATCVNEIGSYRCYCRFGYEGRNCEKQIDWCKENPCKNNGTCHAQGTGFNCQCAQHYTGTLCHVKNWLCVDINKCENGGTCKQRGTYSTCTCKPGFTGDICETNIDDCASGPCKRGATCVDGIENYNCTCFPGFTGRNCDIEIKECKSNPCKHGRCVDLINEYACICDTGWVGKNCDENPNDCSKDTCLNGGNCTDGLKDFTCKCQPGFRGKRCEEDLDECSTMPCSAEGTERCIDLVNDYYCKCKPGYAKSTCSFDINECLSNPCLNKGRCKNEIGRYVCQCPYGFSGINCEKPVRSCADEPCLNDGVCQEDGSRYNCSCQKGVFGQHCEYNQKNCTPESCENAAKCVDGYGDYTCESCKPGYSGDKCQFKNKCKLICENGGTLINDGDSCSCTYKGYCPRVKVGTREAYGIFEWPETPVGDNSTQACPFNTESSASRECWYTNQTDSGGVWGPIVVERCKYGRDTRSKYLFLLAQKEVNISNVVKTTQEVKKLSFDNSSHPLQAGDISNIATVLQKIVAVKQKANEIFEDFYTTVDNVLDASAENVFKSQQDTNSSSRIVEALNNFVETLVIGPSGKFPKVKRNYAVNLQAVQPQKNFSGLTFSGIVRKHRESPSKIVDLSTEFNDSVPQTSSTSISIPRTIFDESTITNSSRQQRIIFVFYKKTSFFKVSLEDTKKTSSRLNSFVIAGSIKGLSVANLSDPVQIALQSVARGDANSNLCSYWDFSLGNWSQEGCRFQSVLSYDRILCNCNHLTNFAMLMDINPVVDKCLFASKNLCLLAQKEVNISNVVKTTQEVKKLSFDNSSHPLQATDINNIATVLQKIVAVKQKANETYEDFYTTVDNVLDASVENVLQSQQDTNSSSRIVEALNNFLETLVIGPNGTFRKVIKRNYAVNIQAVQPQNFSGLTFSVTKPRKSPLKVVDISTELNDSVPQASSTSISIPRTIFDESTITNSSRQQRIIFVFYKKTSFFKVSLEDTKKTSSRLNSFVIAGSIKGLSVANLSDPVEIALQSVARGNANSTLCSYWDFILANWSQEGCRFKRVLSDGRILCNCNHLTNFAMLMDINPAVTTKHERTLDVISYVGCALSLVGLTLTIITILILRKLRSKLPMKILLNFCTALSLTLIVFLAAPEGSKPSSLALCRTAAVALHYFLLAAFLWMAVEAFTLYLAIIKARKIDLFPSMFMLKCCLFAWGTPAIIVAITMIVALDKYGDKRNCRLHGVPFIVAFLTPVTLILAGNIVAFCLIIRSLLTSGNRVTSNRKVSGFQQARQGIAIMVLLGLTWLFGIVAVDDAKLAFQWLFRIFNSLQGVLVFILFCILPAGTRQHLRKLFRKKSNSPRREDPLPLGKVIQ